MGRERGKLETKRYFWSRVSSVVWGGRLCFFFFFFLKVYLLAASRDTWDLFSNKGLNLQSLPWKHGILTTGPPPGEVPLFWLFTCITSIVQPNEARYPYFTDEETEAQGGSQL